MTDLQYMKSTAVGKFVIDDLCEVWVCDSICVSGVADVAFISAAAYGAMCVK